MDISFQKILLHDIGQSKVHPGTARYSAEKTRHVLYFVIKCKFMHSRQLTKYDHLAPTKTSTYQKYSLENFLRKSIRQKGWLAIATLKPLVEREFLSTNEKPGFQRVANQTKLLPSPFFYDVSETNDEWKVMNKSAIKWATWWRKASMWWSCC